MRGAGSTLKPFLYGLALENFNVIGAWRDYQDGEDFRGKNSPAIDASVHVTEDLPSLSVVLVVADKLPPPTAVHVSGTPATGLFTPSSAWTISGCASGAARSPD